VERLAADGNGMLPDWAATRMLPDWGGNGDTARFSRDVPRCRRALTGTGPRRCLCPWVEGHGPAGRGKVLSRRRSAGEPCFRRIGV
jgi:hypothetical protein